MIELLIVIAVVAFLLLILYLLSQTQLGRSRDAVRKADLERIKIAFEDYYNDNGCYPDADVLQDCRGTSFQPYLPLIPCDPLTKQPYIYVPYEENQCGGYRVYSILEDQNDPQIVQLGCDGPLACGIGEPYWYGIAAGIPVFHSNFDFSSLPTPTPSPTTTASPSPTSTPTPTPTPEPTPPTSPTPTPDPVYVYACDVAGFCNIYDIDNPFLATCPQTYSNPLCDNQCDNPANRCGG